MLEEEIAKAELDKLIAERNKLEAETKALNRPALFKPTAWIPLLAGVLPRLHGHIHIGY